MKTQNDGRQWHVRRGYGLRRRFSRGLSLSSGPTFRGMWLSDGAREPARCCYGAPVNQRSSPASQLPRLVWATTMDSGIRRKWPNEFKVCPLPRFLNLAFLRRHFQKQSEKLPSLEQSVLFLPAHPGLEIGIVKRTNRAWPFSSLGVSILKRGEMEDRRTTWRLHFYGRLVAVTERPWSAAD